MVNHPKEARFLLPVCYEYIEKNKLSEEEAKALIKEAMQVGDAFWDKLERGLALLTERFG